MLHACTLEYRSIKALFHETDGIEAAFCGSFRLERLLLVMLFSQIAVRSHKNGLTGAGFKLVPPLIWPISAPRATVAVPRPPGNSQVSETLVSLFQRNNPVAGGAPLSGTRTTWRKETF